MNRQLLSRNLRVFAFDPSIGRQLTTLNINEVLVSVPGSEFQREDFAGPSGEYIEVIDIDPASGLYYPPVDLNQPTAMAGHGLAPDEANPQFHQQMVYAVAMATIRHFENALGRPALWAPRQDGGQETYVGRLRIYPHAIRDANAFYSPSKKALLFGYFGAGPTHPSLPEDATIFTCLSHDVIAHETTHALLDGLHPRWREGVNEDILGLHEAFADIVALFQHFSYPDILRDQIARTRGDLSTENLLGQLAREFGQALGYGGGLRDAIGEEVEGVWVPKKPDRTAIVRAEGPHDRGAILVAAVFHAFLNMYRNASRDLFRIASGGSGILPEGELHPDLVGRLSDEAARVARHVLEICIRALDYCPPVNVDFGDYLRAIITADADLFPTDARQYRVAILEAFIAWGLTPAGLSVYSTRTLQWPSFEEEIETANAGVDDPTSTLEFGFEHLMSNGRALRDWLERRTDGVRLTDLLRQRAVAVLNRVTQLRERAAAETSTGRSSEQRFSRAGEMLAPTSGERSAEDMTDSEVEEVLDEVLSMNLLELGFETDRELLWHSQFFYGQLFWGLITHPEVEPVLPVIGIRTDDACPRTVRRSTMNKKPSLHVHGVRMARRRGIRDQVDSEYVVEITQTRRGYLDPAVQAEMDAADEPATADFYYRAGCTLLFDARSFQIRRVIRTSGDICDDDALDRLRRHIVGQEARPLDAFRVEDGLRDAQGASFAHLHRLAGGQ